MNFPILGPVADNRLPDRGVVFDLLLADGAGVALFSVYQLVSFSAIHQQAVAIVVGATVSYVLQKGCFTLICTYFIRLRQLRLMFFAGICMLKYVSVCVSLADCVR